MFKWWEGFKDDENMWKMSNSGVPNLIESTKIWKGATTRETWLMIQDTGYCRRTYCSSWESKKDFLRSWEKPNVSRDMAPRMLFDKLMQRQLDISSDLLPIYTVLTEETLCFQYDPETKHLSMQCRRKDSPRRCQYCNIPFPFSE